MRLLTGWLWRRLCRRVRTGEAWCALLAGFRSGRVTFPRKKDQDGSSCGRRQIAGSAAGAVTDRGWRLPGAMNRAAVTRHSINWRQGRVVGQVDCHLPIQISGSRAASPEPPESTQSGCRVIAPAAARIDRNQPFVPLCANRRCRLPTNCRCECLGALSCKAGIPSASLLPACFAQAVEHVFLVP